MDTVQLGRYVLPVVPQKHARLRHRLSAEDFQKVFSGEYSHESYRVLGVLIPALPEPMPEWEWDGYTSEEAQKNDDYNEDLDPSPTTAQIVEAFEKALTVSGAGRLGKLLELISSSQKMMERAQSETPTTDSPGSPGGNGESASQSTGTSPPTSIVSTD